MRVWPGSRAWFGFASIEIVIRAGSCDESSNLETTRGIFFFWNIKVACSLLSINFLRIESLHGLTNGAI